jgi:acyl-CoA thioester hydrolase
MNNRLLPITLPFTVKTYDVDFAGIVHNLVYIRWLEDLRLQILADYYPVADLIKDGIGPVLTRTEIDYKAPIRIADQPAGHMWLSNLSKVRWELEAEIVVGDVIAAVAHQHGLFINLKTGRPIPIPDRLRLPYERAQGGGG